MPKMKKLLMVAIIVFVSCLLVAMSFEVKATDGSDPVLIGGNLELTLDDGNDTATEPDLNTTTNTEENTQPIIQPEANVTENVSNSDKLPQTGVTEDITVMFFIIVCAVSAIYAYKKIRDYKA